ncbi:hypothetical protein Tco_1403562 [Tanacetum coccineum]
MIPHHHLRRSKGGKIPRVLFEIEGENDNEDDDASLMAMFAGDSKSVMEALKYKEWGNTMKDELHCSKIQSKVSSKGILTATMGRL